MIIVRHTIPPSPHTLLHSQGTVRRCFSMVTEASPPRDQARVPCTRRSLLHGCRGTCWTGVCCTGVCCTAIGACCRGLRGTAASLPRWSTTGACSTAVGACGAALRAYGTKVCPPKRPRRIVASFVPSTRDASSSPQHPAGERKKGKRRRKPKTAFVPAAEPPVDYRPKRRHGEACRGRASNKSASAEIVTTLPQRLKNKRITTHCRRLT